MGINATTPYFINQKLAVRLRVNAMYHEHVQNQLITWSPYINTSLGVIGISGRVGDIIRVYGEGGIIGLFPSDDFSTEGFEFGGYGLFGFEFYMVPKSFIEVGAVGTGAKADKIAFSPIYSNGLIISAGFRVNI